MVMAVTVVGIAALGTYAHVGRTSWVLAAEDRGRGHRVEAVDGVTFAEARALPATGRGKTPQPVASRGGDDNRCHLTELLREVRTCPVEICSVWFESRF